MERQARLERAGRGLSAALLVAVPLAGCVREQPAYVLYPDRAIAPDASEDRYFTLVVRRGDSMSEIAARCELPVETIARLNDLEVRGSVYPGEALLVPYRARAVCTRARHEPRIARADVGREPHRPRSAPSPLPEPQARPGLDSVASQPPSAASGESQSWLSWWTKPREDTPSDSAPARFMWPVQGRVIEPFGRGGNGERNDGINIATEEGAPIHAAGAGTVTYAGNELKGYGNLVLIKHSNGYVTAYAHAQSISVKRGETVERGEVIGTAGTTGDVDRPQLHFEIRRGVEPVDPARLLAADRAS